MSTYKVGSIEGPSGLATMRAVAVKKYSKRATDAMAMVADFPAPVSAAPSEVIVRVVAAGLNDIDINKARGKLRDLMGDVFPYVVGYDFSGIVVAVGREAGLHYIRNNKARGKLRGLMGDVFPYAVGYDFSGVVVAVGRAGLNDIDIEKARGTLRGLMGDVFPYAVGYDYCGVVVAVGREVAPFSPETKRINIPALPLVTRFSPDEEVYGCLSPTLEDQSSAAATGLQTAAVDISLRHLSPQVDKRRRPYGTLAEYCICDESEVAHKPANLQHEAAASVPLAALTAIQAFETARFNSKGMKKVFISGGGTSVSTVAIQLAKEVYQASHIVTTVLPTQDAAVASLFDSKVVKVLNSEKDTDSLDSCRDFDFAMDNTGDVMWMINLGLLRDKGIALARLRSALSAALHMAYSGRVMIHMAESRGGGHMEEDVGEDPEMPFGGGGGILISTVAEPTADEAKSVFQVSAMRRVMLDMKGKKFHRAAEKAGIEYHRVFPLISGEALEQVINPHLEKGTIRPIIDSLHTFDHFGRALKILKSGNPLGKVVVRVVGPGAVPVPITPEPISLLTKSSAVIAEAGERGVVRSTAMPVEEKAEESPESTSTRFVQAWVAFDSAQN
ncbi:hypothetical protein JKP88DRAFT_280315 [Tribonema minus]|uniref:Enoyl reductase (ER) domain-containing protein n=1 Tax=Tribonema minus TaxID=303371 RepID=A0A836CBB0_9STRA|nr:hypothetical protein JKP88DRAFT_280315 [Tribonema minus]